MSDVVGDGKIRIAWLEKDGIENITAPTLLELAQAVDVTERVTPDGLNLPVETADVDNSNIASRFTTNRAGRISFSSPSMTFMRGDDATDDFPWNTFKHGVMGYWIVRDIIDYEEPFAVGDEVAVYPVECGEPSPIPHAPNELRKFTAPVKIRRQPALAAVVVSGD